MNANHQGTSLKAELRLSLRRAREVWAIVPGNHKWALGIAAVVMAVTGACSTAMPLLLGQLLDCVKTGAEQALSRQSLYWVAVWFLSLIGVAYLLREILNVFRRYLVENTCTRINRDMTVRLVDHMMKVDLATLHRERLGTLNARISRSVDGFIRFLRLSFLDFLPAIITGAFALTAAFTKQPLVGLVMLGVIPIAVFLTIRQMISQKGVRLKLMRNCEEIDGAIVEHLGGIEYVRSADTHDHETRRLALACEKRRSREIRHHFEMSLFGCAKALNEGFFHIVVLGLAIYLAITSPETVSYGDVLTFSMLFLNVMAPLNEIHRVLDEGHEASLRVGDLLAMLAEPQDRSFVVPKRLEPRVFPGEPVIVFDDVVVEYRSPEGKWLRGLDHVSLSIQSGETIGVAGPTGSGKSTWLKALLRLAHPCAGSITLGGVPLEMVGREDIARLVGYVSQVPFISAGSIAENIAYGNDGVTLSDIRHAAEQAHLHDEIMLLPGGYGALVTERGQNLSGGQRQRLALARILLKQSNILILDEATAALDNISERFVQRSLGLRRAERTTILVAHRLSTLRDADRIVVFAEGRIVEVGTYDQLVQKGGVFTELVMSAQNASPNAAS